jgi:hypothetical protein
MIRFEFNLIHGKNGKFFLRRDGAGELEGYNKLVEYYHTVKDTPEQKFVGFDIDETKGYVHFQAHDTFYHRRVKESLNNSFDRKECDINGEGTYDIAVFFHKMSELNSVNEIYDEIYCEISYMFLRPGLKKLHI